jgi:hypothetical protein
MLKRSSAPVRHLKLMHRVKGRSTGTSSTTPSRSWAASAWSRACTVRDAATDLLQVEASTTEDTAELAELRARLNTTYEQLRRNARTAEQIH